MSKSKADLEALERIIQVENNDTNASSQTEADFPDDNCFGVDDDDETHTDPTNST